MTRRILHLTRDFPPRHAGGISTAVGGLIEAATGLEPSIAHAVLSFDGWRPARGSASVASAPKRDVGGPVPIVRIEGPDDLIHARAFADAFAPDVFHVHHALLFAEAETMAAASNAPILYTAHVLQRHLSRLRGLTEPTLSDAAETHALQRARSVSVPSEAAREQLRVDGPPRGDAIHVTRLAVPARRTPPILSTTSKRSDKTPTITFLGRFDALKGLPELLEAAPRVLAHCPSTHIIVAGGIPENPKAERRWHRRLAPLISPRFHVLPWQSRAEADALLARTTILVAPSRAETFGLTVLEASSHGAQLVLSDIAAHREIAPHARFFPVGDVDAIAQTLMEAVDATQTSDAKDTEMPLVWRDVVADWVHFWSE